MDLDELQEYFMDYVDGCRINVENIPFEFMFENLETVDTGDTITLITSRGQVPNNWVNNACMNLQNRYPHKNVNFLQFPEDNNLFCFELRNIDVEMES